MNTLKGEKQLSNSDLRDTVKVFCRLRPLQDECEMPSIKLLSSTTLTLSSESKTKPARRSCNYVFRHVFTSYSGQREVFDHVALPLLEDLLSGKNGLLFTYGVTGSGKTYTLTGDQSNPGIMPSCINTLFNSIGDQQAQKYLIKSDRMNGFEIQSENEALEERFRETKSGKRLRIMKKAPCEKIMYANDGTRLQNINSNSLYAIFISYTEIYNNAMYDLLDESNSKILQAKIIREDYQKNMYVNGVEEVEVKSAAEAFDLFCMGQKRKRMAHTLLNAESSRSHSIFNIRVVQLIQNVQGDQNLLKVAQLSLVDLAGSERCNRTNNTGIRLKEASSINNSLMTLRTCLEVLRENQTTGSTKVIPYRDSRLTLLFKNYFEGEGQVRMIICINPSEQDYEENLQVLKFAEMTQEVQINKSEPRYLHHFKTPNAKSTPCETPKTAKIKNVPSFSFGPKIPSVKLDLENSQEVLAQIENVIKCLHVRKQRGIENNKEFVQKEKHLRKRLLDINQESVLSKSEIRNLKAMLKKEKLLSQNLNVKIADLETNNHSMQSKNNDLQELIRTLQLTIDEKNLKINQNCLEQEKNKQKFVIQTEKLNKELDDKLRHQRYQMEVEMQAKDLKLRRMKEIIDSEEIDRLQQPVIESPAKIVEENLNENNLHQNFSTTTTTRSTIANRTILNRGRVKSGDVWLEHNSIKPVPLTTVMQPSMKKRKSVDKLKKATDVTNTKQTKYCLIAQEPDAAGDVETKLYKGDIIPTCGGGAQVVFNGVECLREESPTRMPLSPHNK